MELKSSIRLRFFNKTPLFYFTAIFFFFFFFFSVCAFLSTKTPCLDTRCHLTGTKADFYFQECFERVSSEKLNGEEMVSLRLARTPRRLLGGLGSSPPRCISKCGRCTPCKPVHVPVPPGTPVTAEYYPEAWRCKCGNKLYMP
ncbi:EPIDERMAL PATTERNING FACTOR-like protein 6 [Cornus florida]|uniref:EPIDERMAL PATTERNING FACTOR-like protein 6 n=1 Tax=Cornus florida TaxID=4283 RepID=UPI002898ACCA|nr:EPIDERMAL PATTERNING FACTOR-like protein 6 [Cornus florida]